MKITAIEPDDDCFDGSAQFTYVFDDVWSREEILRLAAFGSLECFWDFPRPYFRVIGAGGAQVRGVGGGTMCTAAFPRDRQREFRRAFEALFE
jgi:hypothetical protein